MIDVNQMVDASMIDVGLMEGVNVWNQPLGDVDPIDWIEKNFFLADTGRLMTLHERQRRPLVEALRRDDNDHYIYNTVLWSWPKKSAKSSVIAAVVLFVAATRPRSSIKLVANDLKQADSRVGAYVREAVKLNPDLRDCVKISVSNYLITFPNGSRIEMVPIDPSGEAGGNDDIIVYSELWGWKSKAHQKMWSEMTLSPTKYGNSQRWIDTYAGEDGEAPILERLYRISVKEGYQLWDDWEVYVSDAARLLTVWVTQHHLPWQTSEDGRAYYAEQSSTLTPNEYDRMHGNLWVSSVNAFVPMEWWAACRGPIPPMDKYREIVVAMDAAVSGDCFGIVAVARTGDRVYPVFIRKWQPKRGQKLDYTDLADPSNTEFPEGVIRWLIKEYNVLRVGYDPYQLHHLCNSLAQEGLAFFEPFNQGQERAVADKALYDIIRDRRLVHDGNPDLTEHVGNANRTADDKNIRIVKRAEHLKIDLVVTLSMGCDLAFEVLPE